MKADFTGIKRLDHMLEISDAQCFFNRDLTLIANCEFAAIYNHMASGRKFKPPHLKWRLLQWNPRRNGLVILQRPIILVCMPWRNPATAFFKKRLVVIKANAIGLHQIGGDFRDARAENQSLDRVIFTPQVK